jgi:hypothetical protein
MSDMSESALSVSGSPVPVPWYKKSAARGLIVAALLLVLLGMWRCGSRAVGGTKVAKEGVLHFRERFNHSQYHEIYIEATQNFRDSGPEAEVNAFFDKVHQKLGDEVSSGEPTYFANVSTGGTFVTLTYDTEFARGKGQERFVWRIEGQNAVLVRYDINSKDLIMK